MATFGIPGAAKPGMARLSDIALLELARSEAEKLFEKDKTLEKPEHSLLAKELARV